MPRRSSAGLALALLLSLSACGGAAAPPARSDRAVLEVSCPVADAVLWLDGRYVAQLRDIRGGVALRPGHHQVELRHDRYHAYYGEVDLRRGERRRIDVPLAEALP
jgi:hypothetical protein